MIGICGAHRTGKTTLARTVSELSGFHFLETNASGTFKRLGCSPKEDMDLKDRLFVQTEILNDIEEAYRNSPTPHFITDRTPLDTAAYLIADVHRTATKGDPWVEYEILRYVDRCLEMSEQWFSLLVLVQPGIQLKDHEDKAPASPVYIEHINDILIGLLMGRSDEGINTNIAMIRRGTHDLRDRVEVMLDLTGKYFPHHMLFQDNCSLM